VSGPVEELKRLQGEVRAAEVRVQAFEAERLRAGRSVERALGPLRDYYAAVGAGDRAGDPALEQRLRAAARDAEAAVSTRLTPRMDGRVEIEVRHEEVESKLAGAKRAVEEKREAVREFAVRNLEQLAAARLERSLEVGRRYVQVVEDLARIDLDWSDERGWWGMLGKLTGSVAVEDLPDRPLALDGQALMAFRNRQRSDQASLAPAPRWLLEGEREAQG
jgi:hypothetical protein